MYKVGTTPSVEKPTDKAGTSGPEPRWYIFRCVNFVAVGVLGWILADYGVNATEYWHENDSTALFKFLVAWSLLMCYFFGFFGVTFVHDLTDEAQVSTPQPVVKRTSRNIQPSDIGKPVKSYRNPSPCQKNTAWLRTQSLRNPSDHRMNRWTNCQTKASPSWF